MTEILTTIGCEPGSEEVADKAIGALREAVDDILKLRKEVATLRAKLEEAQEKNRVLVRAMDKFALALKEAADDIEKHDASESRRLLDSTPTPLKPWDYPPNTGPAIDAAGNYIDGMMVTTSTGPTPTPPELTEEERGALAELAALMAEGGMSVGELSPSLGSYMRLHETGLADMVETELSIDDGPFADSAIMYDFTLTPAGREAVERYRRRK